MKKPHWRLLLILLAIAFRLFFFIFGLKHLPISTDEAWPALMGLHVMKGEFPVFYWGQNYMGAQQAFFDAIAFTLFGVNTFAARIYPLFFSCVYLAATCLLARRIYGKNAALITLALLAVPVPYLTMAGALSVPPEYLPLTAMGSLALVLLAGIQGRDASPRHPLIGRLGEPSLPSNRKDGPAVLPFFLLGLLLGFMFWLHIVAISFIAVALLFLFLRDKLLFIRPAFWLMALAFFIGGLPFWWFNLNHNWITFADMAGAGDWPAARELGRALFGLSLHFMIGTKVMLYGDSCHFVRLPNALALAAGLASCGLIMIVILARWRGLRRWLRWRPVGADGTAILLALAILVLYCFCRSERSAWANVRFILPIMAVWPVLLAAGLEQVRNWSRTVFAFFLIVIIGAQVWGNFLLYQEWSAPAVVGKKLELPDTAPLHFFLKKHEITHAYAHYWISYRLTFEAREEIICAEPFNERFPGRPAQYLDAVHGATNVAFIIHPTLQFVPNFEEHLRALGGTYKKEQAGDFTIYYDIAPPYGKTGLREISPQGFKFSAKTNSESLMKMVDNNLKTCWATGAPQKAGDYLLIDLGSMEKIYKMRFDLSGVECDAPNGFSLEVSKGGKEWKKVYEAGPVAEGFFWENDQPWMFVGNNFFTAAFAPIEGKYIRLILTAGHPRCWWSITEVRIFGPDSDVEQ